MKSSDEGHASIGYSCPVGCATSRWGVSRVFRFGSQNRGYVSWLVAQAWKSEAVVNGEGEGHADPCRGTGSGEGQMLGLD